MSQRVIRRFVVLISLAAITLPAAWAVTTTLTVNKSGSGTGTVTSTGGAISCGKTCSTTYTLPAWVRLEAIDGTGVFQGWEGEGCSGDRICNLWMNTNRTVNPKFIRPRLTVRLQSGPGQPQRVISDPAGIDCPTRCEAEFNAHSTVTLIPTLPPGFIQQCVNFNACRVPMDNIFIEEKVGGEETVTVGIASGNGTMVSSPAPSMRCPPTCKAAIPVGQTVFLRAAGSVTWGAQNCLEGRQDSNQCSFVVTGLMYAWIKFNGGSVFFFQDINYGGSQSQPIPNGRITMSQLQALGVPNDWASSVKVPSGIRVTVFEHDNFQGRQWTFTADTSDFTRLSPSANDQMSSVIIE